MLELRGHRWKTLLPLEVETELDVEAVFLDEQNCEGREVSRNPTSLKTPGTQTDAHKNSNRAVMTVLRERER